MHPRNPVAAKVRKNRFGRQDEQHCSPDEQSKFGSSSQSTTTFGGGEESLSQWPSDESRIRADKNTSPD